MNRQEERDREINNYSNWQTVGQTYKWTDRKKDRHMDRHTVIQTYNRQKDRKNI